MSLRMNSVATYAEIHWSQNPIFDGTQVCNTLSLLSIAGGGEVLVLGVKGVGLTKT